MIEIKKFENVYGIKKLNNPKLINGNTLIYSPNGTMKTSFSDGFQDIINGVIPRDEFIIPQVNSSFEISDNGNIINNGNVTKGIDAFVFNTEKYTNEILTSSVLEPLVMSKDLRDKYKDTFNKLETIKNSVNELLSINVFNNKKADIEDLNALSTLLGKKHFLDTLLSIPALNEYKDSYYNDIDYKKIFNEKTEDIINEPNFQDACNNYKIFVDKKLDDAVFENGFTFEYLQKLSQDLVKNKFFAAGHKIKLNGHDLMGEKELKNYIDDIIKRVFESGEVSSEFSKIKTMLNKNSTIRAFTEIISRDTRIIRELSLESEFKKRIIFTKLSKFKEQILEYQKEALELKDKLEMVVEEANKTTNIWKQIIDKYNSRFIANKLDVEIVNVSDAVLDLNPPIFKKKIKGTNLEVDENIQQRFSTGERRAILILNLLFEVELRKGKQFALILDDISDSFDYKNKYAIIECLRDFSEDSNIQLIILTHNFDFYRSISIALNKKINKRLFAYSSNGIVSFSELNTNNFKDYSYYTNWKNNGNYIDLIAIIPFLRNVSQLNANSNDADYIALTKFLHYDTTTNNLQFSSAQSIFLKHNVSCGSLNLNENYINKLVEEAKKLLSKRISEIDLRAKVVLAILIRLLSDKFMIDKYFAKHNSYPLIQNKPNQSRELYNLTIGDLLDEEKSILQTCFIIAPSFIHLNSFMYEPLVDVGTEKIKDTASKIIALCGY